MRKNSRFPRLPPGPDNWTLSKKHVVCSEVFRALHLFAVERDYISSHVLAHAARSILHGIAKHTNKTTFYKAVERVIKPAVRDEFASLMTEDYNFFKHGSRDPLATSQYYKPELTEYALNEVCYDVAIIYEEGFVECRLFRIYFALKYPELVASSYVDELRTVLSHHGVGCNDIFDHSHLSSAMSLFLEHPEEFAADIPLLIRNFPSYHLL